MSLFYKLCSEISSAKDKAYHKTDKRIATAREYLDTNFRSDNVLDGAAVASGLSRRRFGELFKNNFDVTPNRYLQIKRIEYSKELLGIQELSVGEVAVLCGFSDIYYFSKCFKLETGKTPQNYKKSLQNAKKTQ
jgi:two-component system response regulator YesN